MCMTCRSWSKCSVTATLCLSNTLSPKHFAPLRMPLHNGCSPCSKQVAMLGPINGTVCTHTGQSLSRTLPHKLAATQSCIHAAKWPYLWNVARLLSERLSLTDKRPCLIARCHCRTIQCKHDYWPPSSPKVMTSTHPSHIAHQHLIVNKHTSLFTYLPSNHDASQMATSGTAQHSTASTPGAIMPRQASLAVNILHWSVAATRSCI